MTYRKEYVLGILSLVPLLAAGTYKGIGWLITIIAVYVGIPVLIWSLVVDRLAFLVIGIIRHFRESSGHQYYFEKPVGPPGFSRRILRDFRVLLFVFVLSATIVPQITEVSPADIAIVSNEFVYVAIFILAVPSSIHVLFWVLEDSGLRCHNPKRVTVTAPGAWMSNWLASVGSLGAFLTFAISLGGSLDRAIALTTTLLESLLPSCLLAPTIFYRRVEPGILAKVRESKTAMAMARMFALPSSPSPPPQYPPSMPAPPGQTQTTT
ncbi:hypothetical protein E6H33_08910 [Candidatus Bathyarchaeota archaeon]|nr:MAG: hypothetical protein E6H33_08910 [Candidatus Bathyarchaeota archaeon]